MYDKTLFDSYKQDIVGYFKDINNYNNQKAAFETILALNRDIPILDHKEVYDYAIKRTNYLAKLTAFQAANGGGYPSEELYWRVLKFEAQNRVLDSYLLYLEKNRDPERRFYVPRRNKLIKYGVIDGAQELVDGKIDLLTISMPPGTGKLLANDTPVLTRNGWKNHGDLVVGDEVLSPDGRFVKVTHVFPKDYADCLVHFTNGESIQCHENHEWLVYERPSRCEKVVETKYLMRRKINSGIKGKRGYRNHFMIPNKQAIIGEERELAVPPYTFGAWLGDGTNRKPTITVCNTDMCIAEQVVKDGYLITTSFEQIGCKAISFNGLRMDLHKYGLCNRDYSVPKYIPAEYLTASLEQRLELLAGLLDTDGTYDKHKRRYQFSTTEEKLKDDFITLVSTFGWRCSVVVSEPKLSSSGIQGRKRVYTLAFCPNVYIPCRVERKQIHDEFAASTRIAIDSIERVDPKQGNCIEVEGGLYLVGRHLTTTHNSTLGIFLLSGVMGWFPEEPNLASAHSGLLTRSFYDGVGQILTDPDEYTWHEIFPFVKFNSRGDMNSKEQTINVGSPKRFKSLTCRAINASLTGATRCERILYADDLCSGIEEALSKERMDKLWQTYNTDLKTRKKKYCREIHIQTRWSVHDVVGRLQRLHEDDPRAKFIAIPALNADGESNFDYDFGVGFDTKYFEDMRNSMDDVSFKCLFMNEPIEREGLLYHEDDFERYYELPDREPDAILGVCDTKDRGTDFEFLPLFYQYGDKFYFDDCVYDNGAVEVLDGMCENIIVKHNPHKVQFESNSAGGRTADAINERIKGKCRTKITKKFTTQNKETKIIVNSGWIKEHILLRDASTYTAKSQYGQAIAAIFSYTVAGKNAHDDAVDGLAMFAEMVATPEQKPTRIMDIPY